MEIEIDSYSGFCYGVVNTIDLAEKLIKEGKPVYCLGEIVHNGEEVERLKSLGVKFIDHEELKNIHNATILIRTHGEPPSTYELIGQNNNLLNDGTCPIVKTLQKRVRQASEEAKEKNGQVVLFGKKTHAEVVGILGQAREKVIVVTELSDLEQIDFSRPVTIFSQTTQPAEGFRNIAEIIKQRMMANFPPEAMPLSVKDTICGHVSKRGLHLAEFSKKYETIIFISGKNSSNGKILFEICKNNNVNTHWISKSEELSRKWFEGISSVGICGATSTPRWQLEEASQKIYQMNEGFL